MNDDQSGDQELEAPRQSERVFDISSDLKIKELKDEIANEPPPPALKIFSMARTKDAATSPPQKSTPVPAKAPSRPAMPAPIPPRPPINILGNRPMPPRLPHIPQSAPGPAKIPPGPAPRPAPLVPTPVIPTGVPIIPKGPAIVSPLETGSTLPKSPSMLTPTVPAATVRPPLPVSLVKPSAPIIRTSVPVPPERPPTPTPAAVPTPLRPITAPVQPPVVSAANPIPTPVKPTVPPTPPQVSLASQSAPVSAMQSELASIIPDIVQTPKQNIPAPDQKPAGTPPQPKYVTSLQSEPPGKAPSILKKLRTYEGDVADVLSRRGTSALNMTLAENKRRQGEERIGNKEESDERPSHSLRTASVILLSLILIGAGLGGGYYLYSRSALGVASQQAPVVNKPQPPKPLVPADSSTIIPIDGLNAQAVISRISTEAAKSGNPSSVKEVILAETDNGTQVRATVQTLTSLLGIPVPDIMLRTIAPQWMLGVYTDSNGGNNVFVVVKTDLFQNAFAGMLKWESFMGLSLSKISPAIEERGQFKDEIVKNKDVRAYVGESGRTDFVYSFLDNATLIMAQNDETVAEAVTRLESSTYLR